MVAQLTIGLPAARRIALAAQGFGKPRPTTVTMAHLQRVIDTLGIIQIDSVNVLARSQYLPFFARLGPYDTALLDRARDKAPRRLVETWAHEASLVPPTSWKLLDYRMSSERNAERLARLSDEHPGLVDSVLATLASSGALTARETERALDHDQQVERTHWGWNWSAVKETLEALFRVGEVTSAGRTSQFERRYALTAAVLGDYAQRDLSVPDAVDEMVRISLHAHGIGTLRCLRDYFRLPSDLARASLARLVASGEAIPVTVPGWTTAGYLDPGARRPRQIHAQALLSPFDSLIWQRERAHELFDFFYRIAIYTPPAQRVHGYYVLPFLYGTELVARVDLKNDRANATLLVQHITWEPGAPPDAKAALTSELEAMASWLGCTDIAY